MGVATGVVLRSLPGTYSVSGGVDHPKAAWTVSKTFANGDAEGAFTIDGELTLAGQFAQAEQVVGFKVLVDGVELPQRQLLGGLSVRTDLEVGTTFGLSVAYGSDDSLFQHLPGSGKLSKPFGTIVGNVGAGKQVIDIYGVVVTDTAGRTDIPLVIGGVIDGVTTEIVDGVRAQTISGIGQQGQYDGIKVTLQLSPGHNIPRGDIFRHARPTIVADDQPHTIGCKAIVAGIEAMVAVVRDVEDGRARAVPQWKPRHARLYLRRDFHPRHVVELYEKLKNGLIARYLERAEELSSQLALIESPAPSRQ